MNTINIALAITQKALKEDIESDKIEEFEEMFFDSEPYLINDSLPEEFGIDILDSKITLSKKRAKKTHFNARFRRKLK